MKLFRWGKFAVAAGFLFLTGSFPAMAQDQAAPREPQGSTPYTLEELLPDLKDRAIIMDIVARIVEQGQNVVWNTENSKVIIPGQPVGLKLVGANIVVAVQFTPYFRSSGNHVLVAQGQIWIKAPNNGISYHTTMQSIPLVFGEEIFFFPLGSQYSKDDARIEIQLVLHPYSRQTEDEAPGPGGNAVPQ
ncbi:MAG: hypothetical protein LBF78_01840 [Treponema sp.]|jgi:hypothetical protein|nr:hypothetical protein [Treponema sp.]